MSLMLAVHGSLVLVLWLALVFKRQSINDTEEVGEHTMLVHLQQMRIGRFCQIHVYASTTRYMYMYMATTCTHVCVTVTLPFI